MNWKFWKSNVIKFDPRLLEMVPRVRVDSDADAIAILLYSQAVSLKRIADTLDNLNNLPEQLKGSIEMGIWNATRKN